MKFLGDLAGAETVADELKNFQFPVAEQIQGKTLLAAFAFDQMMEQFFLDAIAQINLPQQCRVDRLQNDFAGFLFHDVAHRPGAQRALGIQAFFMHGKDQQRQPWVLQFQGLEQLNSARVLQ